MSAMPKRGGQRPSRPTLRRLLSAALRATLEQMTLPYRDAPPEAFRFPPL